MKTLKKEEMLKIINSFLEFKPVFEEALNKRSSLSLEMAAGKMLHQLFNIMSLMIFTSKIWIK